MATGFPLLPSVVILRLLREQPRLDLELGEKGKSGGPRLRWACNLIETETENRSLNEQANTGQFFVMEPWMMTESF